jgi:hypothetical protein
MKTFTLYLFLVFSVERSFLCELQLENGVFSHLTTSLSMGVCRIEGASHATAHSLDSFGPNIIERKAKRNTVNMNTTEVSVTVRQAYSDLNVRANRKTILQSLKRKFVSKFFV